MKISARYASISGTSLDDCFIIAERFPEQYGPGRDGSEYCVLAAEPEKPSRPRMGSTCKFSGVWSSGDGQGWAISDDGEIARPGVDEDPYEVDSVPIGIWGLNENCVFVWGGSWEEPNQVFFFDGNEWQQIEAPDFPVRTIHGCAPDCIYAAGRDSGIAKWDGESWEYFDVPVDEVFTSIFVVSKKNNMQSDCIITFCRVTERNGRRSPVDRLPTL